MADYKRPRLDGILSGGGGGDNFDDLWNATDAAGEFEPLPPETYKALVADGKLAESKTNRTPSYKVTFEVIEPAAFAGRRLWLDLWLTPRALPTSKRDLAKLGIDRPAQLRQAPPSGMVAEVKVGLRTDDNGTAYNRVISFQITGEVPPPAALSPDAAELADDDPDESDQDDGAGDTRDDAGFDWREGEQN